MEGEEILSEKKYKKTKRKIAFVALLVFCLGVSLGGYLIGMGLRNYKTIKAQADSRPLSVIEAEMDELDDTIAALLVKSHKEIKENGITEEYYKTQNEIDKLSRKKTDLQSESWKKQRGYGTSENIQKYLPFYIIGGFIIFATLMISGHIYLLSKGREILAYTAQQTIPVAQAGIEKIAPTMRKVRKETMEDMAPVFGEVAKEIAKGIKEGKEEDNKDE